MLYIIFGVGIIIGNNVKGILFTLIYAEGIGYNESVKLQLYANAIYLPTIIVAFFIVRSLSLESRLPKRIVGFPVLTVGIWLFMISLALELSSKLIPYAVYLIGYIPVIKIFVSSSLPRIISDILILLGLFIVFLAAIPRESIVKNK